MADEKSKEVRGIRRCQEEQLMWSRQSPAAITPRFMLSSLLEPMIMSDHERRAVGHLQPGRSALLGILTYGVIVASVPVAKDIATPQNTGKGLARLYV